MIRKPLVLLFVVCLLLCLLIVPSWAADKVLLRHTFKPGDRYTGTVTSKQTITQQLGAEKSPPIEANLIIVMDMEVLKVQPDGSADLKITYTRFAQKLDSPQMKLDYDSGDPLKKDVTHPAIAAYKAMLGHSFNITMDTRGQTTKVEGIEKLRDAILDGIPEGPAREAARKQIGKSMTDEHIARQMSRSVFPVEPVIVGDSWKEEVKLDMSMFALTTRSDYKVTGITDKAVEIAVEGTIDSGEPDPDVPLTATIHEGSSQKGSMVVDRTNPTLVTLVVDQNIDMTVSLSGRSIQQSVRSTTTVVTKRAETGK